VGRLSDAEKKKLLRLPIQRGKPVGGGRGKSCQLNPSTGPRGEPDLEKKETKKGHHKKTTE